MTDFAISVNIWISPLNFCLTGLEKRVEIWQSKLMLWLFFHFNWSAEKKCINIMRLIIHSPHFHIVWLLLLWWYMRRWSTFETQQSNSAKPLKSGYRSHYFPLNLWTLFIQKWQVVQTWGWWTDVISGAPGTAPLNWTNAQQSPGP